MAIFLALLKTFRPQQWLKNLALFAALIFSGLLYREGAFVSVFQAFLVFIVLSSTTYIFNDLIDVTADRKHPYKKLRPIASGQLPIPLAIFALIAGVFIGITWAYALNYFLFICAITYLLLQLLYTTYLKKIPIVDVIVIASGYLIRVYAGAFAISAHMDG